MNDDFSFDDETKNILKKGVAEKKQGRPAKKEEQKRKKCVSTYLTDEEYEAFINFLDGRTMSTYLRTMVIKEIGSKS